MRFNFYLYLILIFVGCGDEIIEEVIESYSKEAPKLIYVISGEGKEKIIHKKITFKENGDTLKLNFGDTLITNYDYYSTDTLKAIVSYLHNQKFGEWKYFHDNGLIDCIMHYNKNIVDSSYQEFYKNGKKAIKGFYKNGIREGEWKFYDSDGSMAGDYKYLNGDIYFSSGYYIDTEYAN